MKDCHFSQYVLFVLTNVVIFLKIQCVIILVFYFKRFTLSYVYECLLPVLMCTMCVCGAFRGQKKWLNPLEHRWF